MNDFERRTQFNNFMINPKEIQKELSKKKNKLITLSNQTISRECKKGFLATAAKLKNSGYFKDSYKIFCYLARKNQLISIYYDDADVLAIMGRPYFEIYDGNDIDRFFEEESQDLAKRAIEILASKQ